MTIVLNGTTGISGVDGSASTPSFQGNDTNTGLFYGTDIVGISTGGSERVRVDASGNVGIGTTSPTNGKLVITGSAVTTAQGIRLTGDTADARFICESATLGAGILGTFSNHSQLFYTNSAERMRITSGGCLTIGATAPVIGTEIFSVNPTAAGWGFSIYASGSASNGMYVKYSTTPNNTGSEFFYFTDATAQRASMRSNGGLANYSANNVNLSDERLKTDILPATTYLDKICSIPVVTFKYKDQTDNELNLGVIAQEVDKVAPELVDHSGFGETPEGESPYLAIYQTDLQYALMKCIQEQQTIINDLKARVTALEANNV